MGALHHSVEFFLCEANRDDLRSFFASSRSPNSSLTELLNLVASFGCRDPFVDLGFGNLFALYFPFHESIVIRNWFMGVAVC